MKKIVNIIVILLFVMSIAGCGTNVKNNKARSRKQIIERNLKLKTPSPARANAKFETHDIRGAISDYDALIQRNPHNAAFYVERGRLKMMNNENRGAIADFDKAIQIDPNFKFAAMEKERAVRMMQRRR